MGRTGAETEALRGLGPHTRSALEIKSDSPGDFWVAGHGWVQSSGSCREAHGAFIVFSRGSPLPLLCLLSGPWLSEKDCFNPCGK